ncbi:MAG: hypothetical protein WDO69_10185 [Pseudomonadota bacterium]
MSIAGDLLTAATPSRLLCRNGIWILELLKLVAVERNVFQPRTLRVQGSDLVLQHLKRSDDNPTLANAASSLIRRIGVNEECSFEAVDGDWVACEPGTPREARHSARPSAAATAAATVADLRAEVCLLRASGKGLAERVARLESLFASGHLPRDLVLPGGTPALSSRPAPARVSSRPATVSFAKTALSADAAPTAEATPIAAEATPTAEAKHVGPRVKLPPAAEVAACLSALLGRKIGVREKHPVTFPPKQVGPCWLSRLVDNEGNEVGAIVTDLAATIGLGGTLMMFPAEQLEAQRKEGAPTEEVISAMDEVANNLSATINQQPEGLHVRVKSLEPFTLDTLDWSGRPALASEQELSEMGRLFLLVR